MRIPTTATLLVLISLCASAAASPQKTSSSASIDLATGVLAKSESSLGLFQVAHGLGGGVMLGSYTLPWATSLLAKGSIVPNAFVKLELFHHRGLSAAIKTSLFWARLNDIDGDNLKVRSLVWPTRFFLNQDFSPRWATTLEFTSVYVRASGEGLANNDTRVHGVAVASNAHVGVIQRVRVWRQLALWVRFRSLLAHSPVLADAQSSLSETARIRVQARANSAELRSGYAVMSGVHWQWRRFSVLAGVGYGTWILPWIDLPVGKNSISGELDLSYRF